MKTGEVRHNQFQDPNHKEKKVARKFKDLDTFDNWKRKLIKELKETYRARLTPH